MKYTAMIIEPRKHKAIEFVLNNILECLNDDWSIVFFHGNHNQEYVSNIVNGNERVTMVHLPVDNLTLEEYSRYMTTKSMIYDYLTEIFLVFQTDSMIFPENKDLIHDYLEYDYVGAPWRICNHYPTEICDFIGNGGFSLRNKKKMLEIMEKIPYNNEPEDLYFATIYDNIILNKPSYEKALEFCVGEAYNNEITLAVHQFWPWDYKINENLNHCYHNLIKKYSDCAILLSLQSEFS
jgi:hypothetical protein